MPVLKSKYFFLEREDFTETVLNIGFISARGRFTILLLDLNNYHDVDVRRKLCIQIVFENKGLRHSVLMFV